MEIDNEKVENNSIFDNSKKSREFQHLINQSIMANRYFSRTQLTVTASTCFNAKEGGGELQVRQSGEYQYRMRSIL